MKTALITGANRGIGLEHARRYAARGVKVFATARDPAGAGDLRRLAEEHDGLVTVLPYDARDADAPAALKQALNGASLDLLLANAGAMKGGQSFGAIDAAVVLDLFAVNALAPLKLAEALADNVAASQRKLIAFQSSEMGSIVDNSSGGYYDYRLSKVSLNMIARSVAHDLRARGVISVALHPGWVKTRMGGPRAHVPVETSVAGQQKLLDALTPAQSGRFFNYNGEELPW